MNIPWKHTQNIKKMTKTEMSIAKLEEKLEKSLNGISELEDLAISKKIPIQEVFA
jgi:ribosomal protein S2